MSSGISPSTPPKSGKALEIAIQAHSPPPSPSPPSLLQPEVDKTKTEVEHIHDTQGRVPNIRQEDETTPDLSESKQKPFKDKHISSEIAVVGRTVITASTAFPALTSISQPEVGELTVANMQRQNDAFEQQVQDPDVHQALYTNSLASSSTAPSSSYRLASQLPGSPEGPKTSDKPVSLRKQPGTTRSGRVWTAPPKRVIESSDEEPAAPKPAKRRPGRPRGYYLGPISCAFCRQQHRRCDYNVVCHRCLKAGIPCDRDGTVVRPSILVLQAKVAAKAQAEADRKAMIAAGLAPPKRYRPQKPRSESDEYQGTKRRRSQSPRGGFSHENIMERAKRKTRPVKKYDPAEDLSAKEYRELQKRLGLDGAAQVDKEHGDFAPQRQQNITTKVSARSESTSAEMEPEMQGEITLERPDTPVTSNASEASPHHSITSSFQEDHMEIDYLESENFGEGSSAHLPPPPPPLPALTSTPAVPPKVTKTPRSSTVTEETKISKPTAPATPNLAMVSATPKSTTKKTIPPATSTSTARRATPKRSVTRHESAIASFAVDPADLSSGVNSDQSVPESPMADQTVVVSKKTGVSISFLAGVPTQDAELDSVTSAVDEIRNPKRRPGRPPGSKFTRKQTALTPANQVAFLRSQDSQPSSPTPNVFQPGVMRRPGRPPWKGNYTPETHIISLGPDREPIIRRGVGRPPNIVRQAIALEKRRQMQARATVDKQPAVATTDITVSLEEALVKKSESPSSSKSMSGEESDTRTKSTRIIKERVAKTSSKRVDVASTTDQQTSVGKADLVKATRAKPLVVTTAPKPVIPTKRIRVSSDVEPIKPTAVAKLTKKTHRSKVVSRESTAVSQFRYLLA